MSKFMNTSSELICCISSEAIILNCLENKNQRFEKIYISHSQIQQIGEIVLGSEVYLIMSYKNLIQFGKLETTQKYHI